VPFPKKNLHLRLLVARFEAKLNPAKQSTRAILSKRLPGFVGLNGDVSMANRSGWNQDGGARGELNHQPQVEQNEVATFYGVVGTACEYGTKPKRDVGAIYVVQGDHPKTTVECRGRKDAVAEDTLQLRVVGEEGIKVTTIVLPELRRIGGEAI